MNEGSGEPGKASELQFDKVELASPNASRTCPVCQKVISDEYYEVNGHVICPSCASEIGTGKGGAPLLRALVFGAGAAIVGTLVWYLIVEVTNYELGIVAIAVGFFVGMAVRRGSRVGGGWRYQALAMALTYFSITASKVPYVIDGVRQAQAERDTSAATAATAADGKPRALGAQAAEEPPSISEFAVAWAFVFAIAFASPFLAGTSGIMGLIIIGIALYEAWKLNRRVPVNGPFRFGMAPATT